METLSKNKIKWIRSLRLKKNRNSEELFIVEGEKMVKEMVLLPYQGMWMSTALLLPLGIFFTYKATTDSAMFNFGAYTSFFAKLFKKKPSE